MQHIFMFAQKDSTRQVLTLTCLFLRSLARSAFLRLYA